MSGSIFVCIGTCMYYVNRDISLKSCLKEIHNVRDPFNTFTYMLSANGELSGGRGRSKLAENNSILLAKLN